MIILNISQRLHEVNTLLAICQQEFNRCKKQLFDVNRNFSKHEL